MTDIVKVFDESSQKMLVVTNCYKTGGFIDKANRAVEFMAAQFGITAHGDGSQTLKTQTFTVHMNADTEKQSPHNFGLMSSARKVAVEISQAGKGSYKATVVPVSALNPAPVPA